MNFLAVQKAASGDLIFESAAAADWVDREVSSVACVTVAEQRRSGRICKHDLKNKYK